LEVANSTMLVAPTHPAAALKRDSGAGIFGATKVGRRRRRSGHYGSAAPRTRFSAAAGYGPRQHGGWSRATPVDDTTM
jgi:hypothetical protein